MRLNSKLLGVVVILIATTVSAPVLAEDAYAGLSWLDTDNEFDADNGWKVFVGWNANKYFGVEGSYRDMGTFVDTDAMATSEPTGWEFSARGMLPIGKISRIYGKVGYTRTDSDVNGEQSAKIRLRQAIYGVGVEVDLKHVGLRAEWEKFDVDGSLESFSLGAYYRF